LRNRLQLLEQTVAAGGRHNALLEDSLRQLPPGEGASGLENGLPVQLTARARRLLRHAQELLKQLRSLGDDALLQGEDADSLIVRYRETVAMTETVVRTVQAFPSAPSVQLRMCEGLEVILGLVADRLAGVFAVVEQRRRASGWVQMLAELLTRLAQEKGEIKPFVLLAETVLNEAREAAPLRFLRADAEVVAQQVAAHSLNVAQVMARVVRHDPDWRGRALDPVLAALVHDVGMLAIPAESFLHAGPLDADQRRAVERHTLLGAELARPLLPTGTWLVEATGGHHERLDGTGYPAGRRDEQVGPLTRLLAVCDVYAALCSDRPHRPASETRTALTDTLLLAEEGALDRFHAERLLQLSFYPVSTVVELADGAVGLVVATHQGRRDLNTPARPVLALLTDPQRQVLPVPRHIDLAEAEGHSIVRSLSAAERREVLGKRFPELV
jgi:HD-GYP domain-containing protein (c-di-GMP phosphodiesterase class II)